MPLPSDSSTTGSHALNGVGRGLSRCRFPTPSSNRPQIASQSRVWVFSPKRVCPSPKGGGAGYCVSWVGWVGPACSQLGHTGPTGLVWGFGGVVPLPGLQNRTQRHTGPSLFFLPKTSLPLPLKGGGAGYRLSWVGRVGPARSQPGHSGPTGPVCSFAGVTPLSGLQNRTQGHTGPNLVSPPFSLSLSRWQPRQLALQAVIHRLVNRKDRIKQRPVSRSAVQSPYGGGQGFDEILVL